MIIADLMYVEIYILNSSLVRVLKTLKYNANIKWKITIQ